MSDKIYIGINDKKVEAKGQDLEYFLSWQAESQESQKLFEAENEAKQQTLQSAISKLSKLGLTEDEAKAIIGIQ